MTSTKTRSRERRYPWVEPWGGRGGIRIRIVLTLLVATLFAPFVVADDWLATDPEGDDAFQPAGVATPCHDRAADVLGFDVRREGGELVIRFATGAAIGRIECAGEPVDVATGPATQWVDVMLTDSTPGNGIRSLTTYTTGTSASMQACVSILLESAPSQSSCSPFAPAAVRSFRIPASGPGWSLVGATVSAKAYGLSVHPVEVGPLRQSLTVNDRTDSVTVGL